jgi:pimeloyl-ACP methyl ester carboxylesterase
MRSILSTTFLPMCILFLSNCTNKKIGVYEEGYIKSEDSVSLFYQKPGDGKEKVIIPLGLYLHPGLKSLQDSLDCTLVFYDVRNRGKSGHIKDSSLIGIWQDVNDLERVRKHFGYERITPVGWSYLGMMVMLYATQHPSNIERIIQIGPVALKWDTEFPAEFRNSEPSPVDTIKRNELEKLISAGYHLKEPEKFAKQWFEVTAIPDLFGDSNNARKFRDELTKTQEPENEWYHNFWWHLTHHFMGSVQKLNTDSLWIEVKKIERPVLTIHGTKDRNAAYGAGRQWAAELKNARLVTIEGAAHLPWYEDSQKVLHSMTVFLKGDWPANAEKIKAQSNSLQAN